MPHRREKRLGGDKSRKLKEYPIVKDCATSNYPRLMHGEETWRYLQRVYRETKHPDRKYEADDGPHTGMQIPFYIRDDGPRGRSLYAAVDIPKGTQVWKPKNTASFDTRDQFVSFLTRLPHDLQCDILLWAYVAKDYEHVEVVLDEASFVNHGDSPELLNLDTKDYTTRDIKAGEELLEDYTKFIGMNEVKWFDKIRSAAWDDHQSTQNKHSEKSVADGYVRLGVPKESEMEEYGERAFEAFIIQGWMLSFAVVVAFLRLVRFRPTRWTTSSTKQTL